MKMEICSIISYFLDYKQDLLLNNLKTHFQKLISKEHLYGKLKLKKEKTNRTLIIEEIKTIFRKNISENIYQILPDIMKTGTSIDKNDAKFKDPINKSLENFNISSILGTFSQKTRFFLFSQKTRFFLFLYFYT